jgi:hypothetical protein
MAKKKYAAQRNPLGFDKPGKVKRPESAGAPQPNVNDNWHPIVRGWWKALGMSDTARVYQPIDWANAWVACDLLDSMYELGFSAGLMQQWNVLAGSLHAPRFDLLIEAEEPEAEPVDEDEAEASSAVSDIRDRLKSVPDA